MSKGYGCRANLISTGKYKIIYAYSCYNVNSDNWKEHYSELDGEICILMSAYDSLTYHNTEHWNPSEKLSHTIRKDVSFCDLLRDNQITIKNASGAWQLDENGTDIMAIRLLGRIEEQCKKGNIPEKVSWFC
ncbi:MAG: hypothetical protein E7233_01785 [Lachnospiraceae bacterium]|nr:hypothetical protein [Lachnospiraceae bacterium]